MRPNGRDGEVSVPIYEFVCPKHGKFEKLLVRTDWFGWLCPKIVGHKGDSNVFCGEKSPRIEFSVPAKRNPRHGEG